MSHNTHAGMSGLRPFFTHPASSNVLPSGEKAASDADTASVGFPGMSTFAVYVGRRCFSLPVAASTNRVASEYRPFTRYFPSFERTALNIALLAPFGRGRALP